MNMPKLTISDLYSTYSGQAVLEGITLALDQGEILALLGPSGCGKTTLLRAIAGLQPVASGSILINGKVMNDAKQFVPSEKRGIGMIFQDYALFPHLTLAENVLFGVKLKGAARLAKLSEMLALVKLEGLEQRYPHELSGGQQQRVSIARALAYEAQILLLDEPFSNIDAKVRQEMMQDIRSILKQRKVSAIFVTHSKDEAYAFADTLALFKQGSIVQAGRPEDLYARPNEAYVAEFMGAVNYFPVTVISANTVSSPFGDIHSTDELNKPVSYQGQLLLRPESIEFISSNQGDAIVTQRRFLGSMCHYQLVIEPQTGQQTVELHSVVMTHQRGDKGHLQVKAHPLVIF
jgi:iron(III) transport system ATP-binding protein